MASENSSNCISQNGNDDSLVNEENVNIACDNDKPPQMQTMKTSQDSNPEILELSSSSDELVEDLDLKPPSNSNREDIISLASTDAVSRNVHSDDDCVEVLGSQNNDVSDVDIMEIASQLGAGVLHKSNNDSTKQRLLDLEDQVRKLKTENVQLIGKISQLKSTNVADISILFKSPDLYKLHKDKFTKLLETFINYSFLCNHSKFQILVTKDDQVNSEEWIVVEDDDDVKEIPGNKRKRRYKNKKKKKVKKQMQAEEFVVDAEPSINVTNTVQYESKFRITSVEKMEDEAAENQNNGFQNTCFNCGAGHNLRDCPAPKNFAKIQSARQKFKKQPSVRYHVGSDTYEHLKPGRLTQSLKEALNIKGNEVPEYIYRMRRLGYPPGWMKEMSQGESDLMVYDSNGKSAGLNKNSVEKFNQDLIIEYPGFNIPTEKFLPDKHAYYHCPSMSRFQSKKYMLEKLNANRKATDININFGSDNGEEQEKENRSVSPPILVTEESERLIILDETDVNNPTQDDDDGNNSQESLDDTFKTIDQVGKVDTIIEDLNLDSVIKTSSFGTPLIESTSSYSKLPNSENFAKDVSQVLIFENLPEATGKFDQLSGILKKVRTAIKGENDTAETGDS